MGVEGAGVSIHLGNNNMLDSTIWRRFCNLSSMMHQHGFQEVQRHLNVERDNIDGDGDALVRNTSCGAAAAVVVFENVLQKSLRMWCKSL